MKKYKLLTLLLLSSHVLLAQRYGISAESGKSGLKIFAVMVLVVIGITLTLYIRQRIKIK